MEDWIANPRSRQCSLPSAAGIQMIKTLANGGAVMQFEQLEVELVGTGERQAIGPLSWGLNAIIGPARIRNHQTVGRPHSLSVRERQALDLLSAADTSSNPTAALDEVAVRLGLDFSVANASVHTREHLVSRERDLVARLERTQNAFGTRDELLNRRRDVEYQLSQVRLTNGLSDPMHQVDATRRVDRYSAIDADLRGALAEIDDCDRALAEVRAELKVCEIGRQTVHIDQSFRDQLQQLEDRLNRWRQTLRDIRAHREAIQHDQTDAALDEQTGTQLSGTLHADSRGPIRSLEAQLHNASKQLDQLVLHHAPSGDYYRPHSFLPETLRSMQKDLHEICHHLSRYEAQAATKALTQQVQQLRRCETELLQSVERLIDQRGQLLRKIADKYYLTADQLTLAFGNWCQCNDHPHLADWLLRDQSPGHTPFQIEGQQRTHLLERIERIDSQRKAAALRSEECRRQLRDLAPSRSWGNTVTTSDQTQTREIELGNELQRVNLALSDWDASDRLRAELDEVRRLLARTPTVPVQTSEYRQAIHRHWMGLGSHLHGNWSRRQNTESVYRDPGSSSRTVGAPGYGVGSNPNQGILFNLAQRLAIAELLARRDELVPVVLQQSLDGLDADTLSATVEYLSRVDLSNIAGSRQVILMTNDPRVIQCARRAGGSVFSVQANAPQQNPHVDVNQVLHGYANDEEAAKWHRPAVVEPVLHEPGPYYLNLESWVEELPWISEALLNRLRRLRVHRVRELLGANPVRLAAELKAAKVTDFTIRNWQSMAELLCNVPGLRPFDARVLVGAGVQSSRELSRRHPGQLLERVERFLATEPGRRILRSGSSYELSRIRRWIGAAKRGYANSISDPMAFDNNGTPIHRDNAPRSHRLESRSARRSHPESRRSTREISRQRDDAHSSIRPPRTASPTQARTLRASSNGSYALSNGSSIETKKFYLDLGSPVVNAPSIGDRLAERLIDQGVHTVEQLLAANAESLAKKLAIRRIDADTVRAWQDQARLVCRIPNLRGHDAQMLAACKITTPELLASLNAETVLSQVLAFARSAAGQRALRGSSEPDLAEVNDWIAWAGQSRSLNAA